MLFVCNHLGIQMAKHSWKSRMLHVRVSTCVLFILCLIAIIRLLTSCGLYNYPHVPQKDLVHELYHATVPHLVLKKSKPDCTYDHILQSTKSIPSWSIPKKFDDFSPNKVMNGSYVPEHCNPLFSVAILVTYRNRQSQLNTFLPYMHNFLRKQNIHYKIFVIEQQDEKPWNKGLLYNIGAKYAIAEKFPCLILHDVDLLPLDESNLYVCMNEPRHLSASIDKFRFVLIYEWLVGGVLAMRSEQFLKINGFSNRFRGWGGEDDDIAERILALNLNILRFPREMSRYTMLRHHPENKNSERQQIMYENKRSAQKDGYTSVMYQSVQVKTQRLCTLVSVKL